MLRRGEAPAGYERLTSGPAKCLATGREHAGHAGENDRPQELGETENAAGVPRCSVGEQGVAQAQAHRGPDGRLTPEAMSCSNHHRKPIDI